MHPRAETILSASRRTDIPGAYAPWFMSCIRRGEFQVTNPFNRRTKTVIATPETIHSIVFWSKNYGPFLDLGCHRELEEMGHRLFFNFTVNSPCPPLEPRLPPLEQRLDQVRRLVRSWGAGAVVWRFDPICFYRMGNGPRKHNLQDFLPLADAMAQWGVSTCITSFYDAYGKVNQRVRYLARQGSVSPTFVEPGESEKLDILHRMADQLAQRGIQLHLCCQKELLDQLKNQGIKVHPGRCINGHALESLYGGNPEQKRDYGQRSKLGCRCTRAVDIGSYQDHPCPHNCLFCYARTGLDTRMGQGKEK